MTASQWLVCVNCNNIQADRKAQSGTVGAEFQVDVNFDPRFLASASLRDISNHAQRCGYSTVHESLLKTVLRLAPCCEVIQIPHEPLPPQRWPVLALLAYRCRMPSCG